MANPFSIFNAATSALGTIGGLVTGGLNYRAQKEANKTNLQIAREQNQANAELAKYQNEFNLEMWNKQNAYNAPAAQMSRLKAAGLNPNLMYGSVSSGNASSAPSAVGYSAVGTRVNAPRLDLPSLVGLMSSFLQLEGAIKDNKIKDSELMNKEAYRNYLMSQASYNQQKIYNMGLEALGISHTNTWKANQNKLFDATYQYQVDSSKWSSKYAFWNYINRKQDSSIQNQNLRLLRQKYGLNMLDMSLKQATYNNMMMDYQLKNQQLRMGDVNYNSALLDYDKKLYYNNFRNANGFEAPQSLGDYLDYKGYKYRPNGGAAGGFIDWLDGFKFEFGNMMRSVGKVLGR